MIRAVDDVCGSCGQRLWTARCSRIACDVGRQNRERDRRARRRRLEVRRPPTLPFSALGVCRLCGVDVQKPRRTWCSDACVQIWSYATSWDRARADLMAFYPGCWECGARAHIDDNDRWISPFLAVDHVVPLWNLTDAERLELKWWLPFNLQLLCRRCHRAKTKREAGRRAEIARESGR